MTPLFQASPGAALPAGEGGAEPLEALRERVLHALGVHFANDDLPMPELERRLAVAVGARDGGQLGSLLADLPPLDRAAHQPARTTAPGGDIPRGVLVAVMGGTVRKGAWVVPRQLKVVAFMGGAVLDMRRAHLAPGVTEVEVFAVMGGVEILVPPGVRVEAMGVAVMGGFETNAGDFEPPPADVPVIRLSGLAFMAGVEAKVKQPNAKAFKSYQRALAAARQR